VNFAARCERAGERVGGAAWRLLAPAFTGANVRPSGHVPTGGGCDRLFRFAPARLGEPTAPRTLVVPTPRSAMTPGATTAPQSGSGRRIVGTASGLPRATVAPADVPVSLSRTDAIALGAPAIELLRSAPLVRDGLRRLLGPYPADALLGAAGIAGLALAGHPSGSAVSVAEGIRLLAETVPPLLAWFVMARTGQAAQANTVAFASAAAIEIGHALAGERLDPAWHVHTWTAVGAVALLVASLGLPPLRAAFGLATPTPLTLGLIGASVLASLLVGRLFAGPEPSPALATVRACPFSRAGVETARRFARSSRPRS
jgi:hypothetical protein